MKFICYRNTARNMTSKSVNFNDLKGDNLTEIISYLHPHTEENKRLKEELIKYMDFEQKVKQIIDTEYEHNSVDLLSKRRFTRKTIANEETHKNILDIWKFTHYDSPAAKKHYLQRKIARYERRIQNRKDEEERYLKNSRQVTIEDEEKIRELKSEFDKIF